MMAVFRNVDKRRPRKNPQQKRARKEREQRMIERIKWEVIGKDVARASGMSWPAGAAKAIVDKHKLGERSEIVFSTDRKIALSRNSALEETWAEYFSLRFYRAGKWFAQLWATAGFQKIGAWMPTDRR